MYNQYKQLRYAGSLIAVHTGLLSKDTVLQEKQLLFIRILQNYSDILQDKHTHANQCQNVLSTMVKVIQDAPHTLPERCLSCIFCTGSSATQWFDPWGGVISSMSLIVTTDKGSLWLPQCLSDVHHTSRV